MKHLITTLTIFVCAMAFCGAEAGAKIGKSKLDDSLFKSDGEFMQTFRNFSDGEVPAYANGKIGEKERNLAVLAALLGVQGKEEFEVALDKALSSGSVTAVEAKEVVYQATAYLGFGKTRPFLDAANRVFKAHKIQLPLESQNSRLRAGNQKQIDFFGERTRESWLSGDESGRIISYWLADNCFGDYYTRTGLTDRQRELITFCFLASQGGCEPQLASHIRANINVGNSKEYLIVTVHQILPYIGLNAIRVVNEVN